MAVEQFANGAASSLNAAMAAADTVLQIQAATLFPTVPQFRLLVEAEIMLVTAVSGTQFTVTRGVEGTSAVAHPSAVAVTLIATSTSLKTAMAGGSTSLALAAGANQNLAIAGASLCRITGPTGAFSLGGFAAGLDGQRLTVFNTTAFAMTISNQAAGSLAANRITTMTGADVVLSARTTTASFIYDATAASWLYTGAS